MGQDGFEGRKEGTSTLSSARFFGLGQGRELDVNTPRDFSSPRREEGVESFSRFLAGFITPRLDLGWLGVEGATRGVGRGENAAGLNGSPWTDKLS